MLEAVCAKMGIAIPTDTSTTTPLPPVPVVTPTPPPVVATPQTPSTFVLASTDPNDWWNHQNGAWVRVQYYGAPVALGKLTVPSGITKTLEFGIGNATGACKFTIYDSQAKIVHSDYDPGPVFSVPSDIKPGVYTLYIEMEKSGDYCTFQIRK